MKVDSFRHRLSIKSVCLAKVDKSYSGYPVKVDTLVRVDIDINNSINSETIIGRYANLSSLVLVPISYFLATRGSPRDL